MSRKVTDRPWRLFAEDPSIPAHIYAGIALVATVFDHDAAREIVAAHNDRLNREGKCPK